MTVVRNTLFVDLEVGDTGKFGKVLTEEDGGLFARISGDYNPVHLDTEYAKTTQFGGVIGHGIWLAALISGAIANTIPGPGSIYRNQALKFLRPVRLGDRIEVVLTVQKKEERTKIVTLECVATNQDGQCVGIGLAEVIAPSDFLEMSVPGIA